jgi:hypothetical protein
VDINVSEESSASNFRMKIEATYFAKTIISTDEGITTQKMVTNANET